MSLSIWKSPLLALTLSAVACLSVSPASAQDEKKSLTSGGLRFAATEGWTLKAKPRAMSDGGMTFKTDAVKSGLDADFYYFGKGQGGSVEANIARWKGQFQGAPKEVETSKLAGGKIEFLHLEGTFMSGPPFGQKTPLKDHAMLAAILTAAEGPVFVKMTGAKDDIAQAIVSFKALVESAFKN